MTRDYVLNSVSMDNPELVAYIREVQLKPTTQQDPWNATQTTEERYVTGLTEGKREGVYVEYISRVRREPLFIRPRVPSVNLFLKVSALLPTAEFPEVVNTYITGEFVSSPSYTANEKRETIFQVILSETMFVTLRRSFDWYLTFAWQNERIDFNCENFVTALIFIKDSDVSQCYYPGHSSFLIFEIQIEM